MWLQAKCSLMPLLFCLLNWACWWPAASLLLLWLKWLHWKAESLSSDREGRDNNCLDGRITLKQSLLQGARVVALVRKDTQKNVQSVWRYEEKDTFCLLSYHSALWCSQSWPEVGKLSSKKKKRFGGFWTLTSFFFFVFCLKRTLACSGLVWFVWSGQNFFNCEEKWGKDEMLSKGSN